MDGKVEEAIWIGCEDWLVRWRSCCCCDSCWKVRLVLVAAVLALVIDGCGWCECEAVAKLLYPFLAVGVVVEIVFVPARWCLVLVTIRHCPSALAAFLFPAVLLQTVNSGVLLAAAAAVAFEGQETVKEKAQEEEDAEE